MIVAARQLVESTHGESLKGQALAEGVIAQVPDGDRVVTSERRYTDVHYLTRVSVTGAQPVQLVPRVSERRSLMELTTPSPARQLLEHAYACFNARDVASALSDMHPDVEWSNGLDGGMAHGRDEVRDYWTRQWTSVDPHVDPLRIDDDEAGHLIVAVHQIIRDLSGLVVAERFVEHAYLVEDGLIRRMEIRSAEHKADRHTS